MVTPLTKHAKGGARYKRHAHVETSIASALAVDLTEKRRRCAENDSESPDFLPPESLVHLIREAGRHEDEATMSALLPYLLERCQSILENRIPASVDRVKYLREEVLCRFAELFAADGGPDNRNELDFYECRFNLAFRSLRITVMRQEEAVTTPLTAWPESFEATENDTNNGILSYFEGTLHRPVTPETSAYLREFGKAIAALPPDERDAVILCHGLGYQEESDDPDKVTAATLCNVTGRSIRNRLTRAAAKLAKFKETT